MRARDHIPYPIRPEIEPGVRRVSVVERAMAVFRRLGERLGLEMGGQQVEAVRRVVGIGQTVAVHDEGLVVDDFDRKRAAKAFEAGKARHLVASRFPGKDRITRGDRRAVSPGGVGVDTVGHGYPGAAVLKLLALGHAILDSRQINAEHADQSPVLVVSGQRPHGGVEYVGLRQHRVYVRMQRAGKLGDAND